MTLSLSIIVPAYNSSATLNACLTAIRRDMPPATEFIVVDDCSTDDTRAIAESHGATVFSMDQNSGDGTARRVGIAKAHGDILLFVDTDVIFPPGGFVRVLDAFAADPDLAAITGRLSTKRQPGYFSDYKNLYMNYIFGRLPDEVTFLYGSVFAVRASMTRDVSSPSIRVGSDTAFGQELVQNGRKVRLLKELEVEHLKRHTPRSFYRNDFMIPRGWAGLFRRYHGWRQIGRHGTGYAHSSVGQLVSLAVAWTTVGLAVGASGGYFSYHGVAVAAGLWLLINARFLAFLCGMRGIFYGLRAVPVTFVDHLVMAAGVGVGFIRSYSRGDR